MDFSLLAAPRALFPPLSPNPSRPAGREGGLTAEFDFFAPTTALLAWGWYRHLYPLHWVAAPAAFVPPLSPNPSRPAGREGGLTAEFGGRAPTTALLARGCDCYFARRFFAYGRRDYVACRRANGGRNAARWGSANPLRAPTTVGSPIVASKHVPQRPAGSALVGAKKSNSAVNSPLAQRGERGWGRVGANKAAVTSQVTNQTTISNFARMPAAAAPLPPLSPNPSRPAGREGGLTAEFGDCAPTTALLARRCDCYFAQRRARGGPLGERKPASCPYDRRFTNRCVQTCTAAPRQ